MEVVGFGYTVNPLLSPPGGLFISSMLEGGFNRGGGLLERGGLFNLAKRITGSQKKKEEEGTDSNCGSLLPVLDHGHVCQT